MFIIQNHRYWDTTASGEPIRPSRASILETVDKITKNPNAITPKYTHGAFTSFYLSVVGLFTGHPLILFVLAVAVVFVAVFGRKRRRSSGGYFQVSEKNGGLLGSSGLGKVD